MFLTRISIMSRLIILSTVLLSVPVGMHLYLREKLTIDKKTLLQSAETVNALRIAHSASTDFGEMKFRLSARTSRDAREARQLAANARAALLSRLALLEAIDRAGVQHIRLNLDRLWQAADAARAASGGGRADEAARHWDRAYEFISAVNRTLAEIVAGLEAEAVKNLRKADLNASVAINLSLAFVVLASLFWLGSTIVVLRTITRPVRELTVAISEISVGNLDAEMPVPGHDELGAMARTLSQFRDSLKERNRLQEEQRRAEEEAQAARVMAERANRVKSDFLAHMSHELRTPLNGVIGMAEMMERQSFGPVGAVEYEEYAKDIHDCGNHLLSMINDILDMSKIEAGKFVLREQVINLGDVIRTATRVLQQSARQANIEIKVNGDLDLPLVWADERAIRQIMINLLSNAIKFSHTDGSITVGAGVADSGAVVLTVADDGIGMAEDEVEKALTPFTQLESSFSRAHSGTGLGLALVKSLTEMHGGKLLIETASDKGTSVHVLLPAERVEIARRAGEADAAVERQSRIEPVASDAARGSDV